MFLIISLNNFRIMQEVQRVATYDSYGGQV